MATLRPFLDIRGQRKDGLSPLKISVSATRSVVFQVPMRVYLSPENWDSQTCRVVRHASKSLFNLALQERLLLLERKLAFLELSGQITNMTPIEVKKHLLTSDEVSGSQSDLISYYEEYILNIRRESTRKVEFPIYSAQKVKHFFC